MRMGLADWTASPGAEALWLNTAVLVAEQPRAAMGAGPRTGARWTACGPACSSGAVSALAFLAGQLLAWRQLAAAGYFLTTNPANAFFYLITAVHGLHVLGAWWPWAGRLARAWRGVANRAPAPGRRAMRDLLALLLLAGWSCSVC